MSWTCCKAIHFTLNCLGPPAQDSIVCHSNLLGILLPAHVPCLSYAFVFLIPPLMTATIFNWNPVTIWYWEILPPMQLLIIPLIIFSSVVFSGFKLLWCKGSAYTICFVHHNADLTAIIIPGVEALPWFPGTCFLSYVYFKMPSSSAFLATLSARHL